MQAAFYLPLRTTSPMSISAMTRSAITDIWKIGNGSVTRTMVKASLQYKVAEGFSLIPEFTLYDYGQNPTTPPKPIWVVSGPAIFWGNRMANAKIVTL